MKKLSVILLLMPLFLACSITPSKIEYGKDACHFCKMTIVEKTHASEIVTKKGKPFKYDAIECLLNDLSNRDIAKIELFLVTDYLNPTVLIDAKKATFLISAMIKSPMGANLSAFSIKKPAEKLVKVSADEIFNWEGIQKKFRAKI